MHSHPKLGFRDWVVILLTVFLIWSGVNPYDRIVWVLEVVWVVAAIVMWAFWLRRLPATTVVFAVLVFHAVVLIVGGIYSYSLVPVGAWVQDWMGRPRNDYCPAP